MSSHRFDSQCLNHSYNYESSKKFPISLSLLYLFGLDDAMQRCRYDGALCLRGTTDVGREMNVCCTSSSHSCVQYIANAI